MTRPVVALSMIPWASKRLFRGPARERLLELAHLADDSPLEGFSDARAASVLADVEVLVTGWGTATVDASVLALAPRLQGIVHAAGTVKGLIDEVCWDRGIAVTSVAAANARPVAEYTLAAIVLANKGAFVARERYVGERSWPMPRRGDPVPGNMDKRVGVISASRVGRLVIELLRPFDLEVVVWDPMLDPADAVAMGATPIALDDLFATSDVVSLHAPLLPETTGMVDAQRLALMKDGATFVNTARGAIVDQDALTAELVSGRISAVVDTTWPEPLPPDSPLLSGLPNLFLTPHLAGSQGTELGRMAADALDELERWSRGEAFLHEILKADLAHIA